MDFLKKVESHRNSFMEIIHNAEFTHDQKPVSAGDWVKGVLDIFQTLKKNNRNLFFIGNGASSSMASHLAVDFTKNGGIRSFANNEGCLLTCFSNDFSYETAYLEMLKRYMNDCDALIAISSSGKSKNIVNAAGFVKNNYHNSPVITLSGFSKDNPLRSIGHYNLFINIGDYGFVESAHAFYLHMLIDFTIQYSGGA